MIAGLIEARIKSLSKYLKASLWGSDDCGPGDTLGSDSFGPGDSFVANAYVCMYECAVEK